MARVISLAFACAALVIVAVCLAATGGRSLYFSSPDAAPESAGAELAGTAG